jgi:hypothetical protein
MSNFFGCYCGKWWESDVRFRGQEVPRMFCCSVLTAHKEAQQLRAEHPSSHKHDNRGAPSPPVSTNLSLESIAT